MTAAIIVTAGRMSGEPYFHPLNEDGNISVLDQQIFTFRQAGVENVIVIHNESAKEVKQEAARTKATSMSLEGDYELLDGVKYAIENVRDKYARLLITCSNRPLFHADTVKQLMNTQAEIAVPVYGGRTHRPIMLAESLYDAIMFHDGEDGLEGFIRDCSSLLQPVDIPEESIHAYVGKADSSSSLSISLCKLRPEVRLSIGRDQTCFGPCTQLLTRLIEETGSMREACSYMDISCSQGWKLIERSERILGFELVSRSGEGGIESQLTEEGRELNRLYREYVDECTQTMDDIFRRKFGDFIEADCNHRRGQFRLRPSD